MSFEDDHISRPIYPKVIIPQDIVIPSSAMRPLSSRQRISDLKLSTQSAGELALLEAKIYDVNMNLLGIDGYSKKLSEVERYNSVYNKPGLSTILHDSNGEVESYLLAFEGKLDQTPGGKYDGLEVVYIF